MNLKYKGNIPFNLQIEARKLIAKFIGLSSFKLGKRCLMKFGPNCAINGPCCDEHRVEGLKDAHEMFPKLLESIGINLEEISDEAYHVSLLALYADLKNQIVVSELEFQLESTSLLDDNENISHYLENLFETFFGPSMHITYLKSKLQSRAVQIRGLLEQQHSKQDLVAKLKEKFPKELFEMNMKNVLQSVYLKLPITQLNLLFKKENNNNISEKELISSYESKSISDSEIDIEMDVYSNDHRGEKDICVNRGHEQETKDNVVTKHNGYSDNNKLSESSSPFKGVVISGRFFRGILEPVDERFASIIEGRDVNVKQYLLQRKRKAASLINSSSKTSGNDNKLERTNVLKSKGNSLLNSHSKSSKFNANANSNNNLGNTKTKTSSSTLMERHNSAERISWETQFMESESNNNNNNNNNGNNNNNIIDKELDNTTGHASNMKIINKDKVISKSNSDKNKISKGRRRFSEKEVLNLIEGIRRFGRDWCRILKNYEFDERSNVDLKDKARNLEKLGLI